MALSPSQRTQRARLAAHTKWARTKDRTAATQPARDGQWQRYLDQVDPDRILSVEEREKRAENARQAHMTRMSFEASKARSMR